MNINALNKKLELIQWLSTIEDEFLIEQLSSIREAQSGDWWNSASEQEKESVMKGLADAEKGKLSEQSQVRKIYEKWL